VTSTRATVHMRRLCAGGDETSQATDKAKDIHKYVHLCLLNNHPMEYRARESGRLAKSVFLRIDPEVLHEDGVKFVPGLPYRVSSVVVPSGMVNLTIPEVQVRPRNRPRARHGSMGPLCSTVTRGSPIDSACSVQRLHVLRISAKGIRTVPIPVLVGLEHLSSDGWSEAKIARYLRLKATELSPRSFWMRLKMERYLAHNEVVCRTQSHITHLDTPCMLGSTRFWWQSASNLY
jgi:hypothetical protein